MTISTHTSRVGCDGLADNYVMKTEISTHTSRVGCDRLQRQKQVLLLKFLLTHPVWDVTGDGLPPVYGSYGFLLTHPVWDVTRRTREA